MKPVKSFFPLALWLLRVSLVLFAVNKYFEVTKSFNVDSPIFYVGALQIIFSILLFIGGFFNRHTLTVISALVILLVSSYHIVVVASAGFGLEMSVLLLYGAVALYFLTTGNQS